MLYSKKNDGNDDIIELDVKNTRMNEISFKWKGRGRELSKL